MQLVILTNESLKQELVANSNSNTQDIVWLDELSRVGSYKDADVFIDLLFQVDHIPALQIFSQALVIINSVVDSLAETDTSFVRINGWPTFLQSNLIEASSPHDTKKQQAEKAFSLFNKEIKWLPDEPGFITPRVISMIINEAYIALKQGVSSKEEIDTAMKLGTNYPYGPFEWAEKIGIENIQALLQKLSKHQPRYTSFISSL